MSYSWYRTGTASVTNGSNVVRFQAAQITTSSTKPVVGDAFILNGSNDIYEVIFIGSDATGEFVRLNKAWTGTSANNQQYAMMRLASGTQNNKLVAMAAASINQKQISLDDMYEWYTSTADTVDFTSPDGSTVTLTTYRKLANEISSVGGNAGNITIVADNIASVNSVSTSIAAVKNVSGNMTSVNGVNSNIASVKGVNDNMPIVKNVNDNMASVKNVSDNMDTIKSINLSSVAMSQSQFEAIRAANNEEFAASGFVHFGKQYTASSASNAVNQGLWTVETSSNVFNIGGDTGLTLTGISKTVETILNIAGIKFNLLSINSPSSNRVYNQIKLPQAPDGKTTYNKSTGVITNHANVTAAFNAQAADQTNVEVVTDRVDMWGFESWLEEVNSTNPFVYPNGLIQSQATTMDGINTSASARPVTYYAVFEGDTGSKGKGVNFFTLTDAQKKKVLGNHKNNLYYLEDGRLVQWRLRQRSFAGAGNGDWFSVDSTGSDVALCYKNILESIVMPQGHLTSKDQQSFNRSYRNIFRKTLLTPQAGVWSIHESSPANYFAINSECYFLVCGTVNRLNSGAYHPSFNPSGAATFVSTDGESSIPWYISPQPLVSSTQQCFNYGRGYPVNGGNLTVPAVWPSSGNIASTHKGRPDGRFYDAIYADGQGGVCRDMRYSAYGLTPTDFADADQRVKNGTYRGFEKAVFTGISVAPTSASTNVVEVPTNIAIATKPQPGDAVYLVRGGVIVTTLSVKDDAYYQSNKLVLSTNYAQQTNDLLVYQVRIKSSIGGSFLQTTQYGNPSALLQAFPNGWQGDWGGLL